MSMPPTRAEDGENLAGEFALGVLEGGDLLAAQRLAASDPAFREQVALWTGRFARLLDEVDPVSPPARVRGSMEQRLGAEPRPSATVHQLRRRLNIWRGYAAAATAIAASLALIVLTRPEPIAPPPVTVEQPAPLVATLAGDTTDARLVATWDSARRSLVIAAAAGVEPITGQAHELWVIPGDGQPRSMGLLAPRGRMHLRLGQPVAQYLTEGATLAVSVEPQGGSPTGLPTGQVIATGQLQRT